jgi:hypothetical protein
MRIRCLRIHSPNLYNLLIYIGNIAKYGGERVRLILVLFRSDTPTHSTLQAINDGGLLITRFMRYWTVTPNQGTIL